MWRALLPDLQPRYRVGTNPAPAVLARLAELGVPLTASNRRELGWLADCRLQPAEFSSSLAPASVLRAAAAAGVNTLHCDSVESVGRVGKLVGRDARLVVDLAGPGGGPGMDQSPGATLAMLPAILQEASRLGLPVTGLAVEVQDWAGEFEDNLSALRAALTTAQDAVTTATALGVKVEHLHLGELCTGPQISPRWAQVNKQVRKLNWIASIFHPGVNKSIFIQVVHQTNLKLNHT